MLPKALLEMDINELFTPEEQKYLLDRYDNSIPDDGPTAYLKDPSTTLNEKLLSYALFLKEDYERKKLNESLPITIDTDSPIVKSILKKLKPISSYFDDGGSGLALKQQTLKRINKIENNYFTKQDAIELRQDIVDNDKVAKTDTILVSQGEIKLFENAEAFNAFKKNIKDNYKIELNENIDYTILEEDYYLKTTVSSGGYKAGSNLLTESNLPKKLYIIDYAISRVSDITTGNVPGMDAHGRLPEQPWYWFRVNADQAQTRINVFKSPMYATGFSQTGFELNSTPSQAEFKPKYLNIYAVKFLKTLTYKTFLINTNKEQIDELKQVIPTVKGYIYNIKVKPKILYIKGQQYVFSNKQAFDDVLANLQTILFGVDAMHNPDSFEISDATLDDFEIRNIENSEEIKIIPKKNIYYKVSN